MLRRHFTPAVVAFLSLLACCLLSRHLAGRELILIGTFAACGAAGIVLVASAPRGARRSGCLIFAAGIGCVLGLWSLQRMAGEHSASYLPFQEKEISGFSGFLTQDSVLSSRGDAILRLSLRDATSRIRGATSSARGRVLVRVSGDYRFSTGQEVSISGGLARQELETGESFTAFVERKDLERRSYSSVLWAARADVRDWVHGALSGAGYPASALMEALLIGAREDVPDDLHEGFRRTGSLHILALSGLHVGVLYALLLALLGFLRGRALKLVIVTLVLAFYQVLAGFMPSLTRATIMIVIGGAGMLLDRDAEPINLLAVAGIAELLVSPFDAFSLSFQLSYLALGGILMVGPLVQRALQSHVPRFVLLPLAMSVGAQVATFPLVAVRFGIYYPSGLLAGLVLVPLTTVVLWGALAWLVVFAVPWPFLHDLGVQGFSILYRVIAESAAAFGRLPGVPMAATDLPWVIIGWAAFATCLAFLLPFRRRAAASAP